MYNLRLFNEADPFTVIETRELCDGELAIGRGDDADWKIEDPNRTLSRRHCVLVVEDRALMLRDLSANGVFLGVQRQRAPAEAAVPITASEMIRMGSFIVVVEPRGAASGSLDDALDGPFSSPILAELEVSSTSISIPTAWADIPARPALPSDGSLLDAFCQGAKLDASQFASDDPAEIMRRLGATYQQMVLGLSDLMSERTSAKSGYHMDRTRVAARENNPFKWMTGQKLAVDLLRSGHEGFLSGPEAVSESFADLKKHILGVFAGMSAAIRETLSILSPETVSGNLKASTFILKSRTLAQWEEFEQRHDKIRREAMNDRDSSLNRAFVKGYQSRLDDLDRKHVGS